MALMLGDLAQAENGFDAWGPGPAPGPENLVTPRLCRMPKGSGLFRLRWAPPPQRLPSDLRPGIFRDGLGSRNNSKAKSSY